ncbi:hypothetical protein SUGI_0193360 [Cryptomeria japonica]|nr:hypothetical protein SUGI_0193360 [Cryptomeria japonica]
MEDGTMACLEKFCIQECRKVNKMGDGLEQLKRLKEFRYTGTDELKEMLKENGIYRKKIKAINPHRTIKCAAFDYY